MTVASSNFTVVFRVETSRKKSEQTSISVTGSVPGLGMWLMSAAPPMEHDIDSNHWQHSLNLVHAPSFIEYSFVWVDNFGVVHEDVKRCFIIPDNIPRLLAGKATKVLVEIVSQLGFPNSKVSIYTPGVVMDGASPERRMSVGVYRKLSQTISLISDLRKENTALRLEVEEMASLFSLPEKKSGQTLIKQLLTEINELKGKVKVICRIRPLLVGEEEEFHSDITNSSSISILDTCAYRDFEFDQVFTPQVSNVDLFEMANLSALIQTSVLIGNNVCVFAYGQTGSGKSHTMLGQDGLVELTIETVFQTLSNDPSHLSVEMIEIYRETVFPLVSEQVVTSAEEVFSLFKKSVAMRATAATRLNATSSRSHCIFRLTVNDSCIYLVDLAGSERTKLSGASGDRMAEANSINKSLSALGLVLNGLLNRRSFIPYRDSKLTKILAPVFTKSTPPSKVVMIANISPSLTDLRESVSTLQFAQRVCNIELKGASPIDEDLIATKTERLNALLTEIATVH